MAITRTITKKMLKRFEDSLVLSKLCPPVERIEWREVPFFRMCWMRILGKLPPEKPVKLFVAAGEVITIKRPSFNEAFGGAK